MESSMSSGSGEVEVRRTTPREARPEQVRFLKATHHPEYGQIDVGEVLIVTIGYAEHYESVGIAVVDRESKPTRFPGTYRDPFRPG
jgi:hypothetical protein